MFDDSYSRIVKCHKASGHDCVQARFIIHHNELIVAKALVRGVFLFENSAVLQHQSVLNLLEA